jgi:hypothetical protein
MTAEEGHWLTPLLFLRHGIFCYQLKEMRMVKDREPVSITGTFVP